MHSPEEGRISAALKSMTPDLRESAIMASPWYVRRYL